jgi:hypothetical protein
MSRRSSWVNRLVARSTLAPPCASSERVHTLTVSNGAHLGTSIQAAQDWRAIIDRRGKAGWSARLMPRLFFENGVPSSVAL